MAVFGYTCELITGETYKFKHIQ